jgi:hypothetical protein
MTSLADDRPWVVRAGPSFVANGRRRAFAEVTVIANILMSLVINRSGMPADEVLAALGTTSTGPTPL